MAEHTTRTVCGAPTRHGGGCRNPAPPGEFCAHHRGRAAPPAPSDPPGDNDQTLDPRTEAQRLRRLQEAAEQRALRAHQAGEGDHMDKLDSSFVRNATLASNLARTRLALLREGQKNHPGGDEDDDDDRTIISLPDNGR